MGVRHKVVAMFAVVLLPLGLPLESRFAIGAIKTATLKRVPSGSLGIHRAIGFAHVNFSEEPSDKDTQVYLTKRKSQI